MLWDLASGKYPAFVYGGSLAKDEIPVFGFHSVDPVSFERTLEFLVANDYQTLTTGELLRILTRQDPYPKRKPVLLTFDDGMGIVFAVAYPLLQKYGCKATVFLVPGLIEEGTNTYPRLQDCWSGRSNLEMVTSRDRGEHPMLTWQEVSLMHESGVIDFQSHTYRHSLIFTSPRIIDFVNPVALARYHPFEFNMHTHEAESALNGNAPLSLGAPIYESAPRLSNSPRYFDNQELRESCVDFVERNGGEDFFARSSWKKVLTTLVREFRVDIEQTERYETATAQRTSIEFELSKSRVEIESRLPGKTVRHLSYPWGSGGKTAQTLCRATGYAGAYWGKFGTRFSNSLQTSPFNIARMGGGLCPIASRQWKDAAGVVARSEIEPKSP